MAVLATDDFAGSGALSANWTNYSGSNSFVRDTGQGAPSHDAASAADIATAAYTGVVTPNDQYAKVTIRSPAATSDDGSGPAVRVTDGDNLYFAQTNTVETKLYKKVGGGFTQLGSDAAACADGDVLYIEANGTNITVKKNGSTIIGPISDASLGSGKGGIWGSRQAQHVDDFEVGDFSAGSVTPYVKPQRQRNVRHSRRFAA